jgi:putative sterol carrier protein
MSDIVNGAVKALAAKLGDERIDGSVKFVIEDEGAVRIDETGVRADDSEADCVLTADAETFRALLDGEIAPTGAFMSGRLRVDGSMGLAMKLGALLA